MHILRIMQILAFPSSVFLYNIQKCTYIYIYIYIRRCKFSYQPQIWCNVSLCATF